MISLAVIILTRDEALHIERALKCLAPIASQVFVIDSGSKDGTVELAKAHGATVLHNSWVNYAQQFQWAMDNAPITTEWVMRLDADEVIESDLASEMAAKLPLLAPEITGVNLKRKHIFMGRWIRHGGRYPLVLLRIWRRGAARIEQRWMDEHMLLNTGRAVTFTGGFADVNVNDLSFFTDKHNRYATREAIDIINQRRGLFARDTALANESATSRARLTRLLKERVYNAIPTELAAAFYFMLRYILQFGFLDGREGLIYHFLQGFSYRFLVGAKVLELQRALGDLEGEAAVERLSNLTGLKLTAPPLPEVMQTERNLR